MPAKNTEVLHIWALGVANTGLSGNMASTLKYYADSSTVAAASESVTIAEIGSSGDYAVTYTPESAGTYKLEVTESSLGFEFWWGDIVTDTPTAATSGDAYCSEANVSAWTGVTDYTASTKPTEAQVLTFMQLRAGEIYSWLREIMGTAATGPTNYATSIDTSTDQGLALSHNCRMANAVGAAMDALEATAASETPARSERVAELGIAYASMKSAVQASALEYIGITGRAKTHIDEGRVTVASFTSREQQGIETDDTTEW